MKLYHWSTNIVTEPRIHAIGSRLDEEVSISDKTFVPNVEWMSEKYDEMNAKLFNSMLGSCDFGIFTTGRGSGGGVLGWFKITGSNIKVDRRSRRMFYDNYYDRDYIDRKNFVDLCKPKIELNGNYYGTEHGFLCTLVHEMCHYYTYMYGWAPVQAHGREFRDIGLIVSERSNGLFTIQRIATAEQMSELELNDEMKARKEKRLANKKASVSAIVLFEKNGEIQLTMTSNYGVINKIQEYAKKNEEYCYVSNDANIIDFLFNKGYRKNLRTWRYWNIESKPWIDEFKTMIISGNSKDIEPSDDSGMPDVKEPESVRTFVIKTSNGTFVCDFNSESELINKIKERFPKMNDETVSKVINNPANYRINEMKRSVKRIINEVIDEFIDKENMKKRGNVGSIDINPDMNLGKYSPLEISEVKRNVTRIRITALADMGRNKEMIMNNLLMLRKARNVGDEEVVNNTVLSALRRYPNYIEFEVIK